MEAHHVFRGIFHVELRHDIMPDSAVALAVNAAIGVSETTRAGAQTPVFRPEFVAPFGDAMRLIDGEKRQRHALQPIQRVVAHQPLRR